MTIRQLIKCDVCGTITLVRTQAGWLDQHPVRIHCGKCNILISGTARFSAEGPTATVEFENATNVEDRETESAASFYAEVSGELLTLKLQRYDGNPYPPAIAFRAGFWAMGVEGHQEFAGRTQGFLNRARNHWARIRRINELWRDGHHEFLPKECHAILDAKQFPMDSTLEHLRGVHQVNLLYLWDVLDEGRFESATSLIWSTMEQLSQMHGRRILGLARSFEEQGFLRRYETKLFERIEAFTERFRFMIPVFGLRFYNDPSDTSWRGKGISTASFEDLKQFYVDSYEVATEALRLIIAYNNLHSRGDYLSMLPIRKDVSTLTDFDGQTKGIRLKYLTGKEKMDTLLSSALNHKLRNAIAHNSYKYDGASQTIVYYPNGVEDPAKEIRLSLLDFLNQCWDLFLDLVNIMELVYQTRKIYRAQQGDALIDPNVFHQRVELSRNQRKRLRKRR